MMLMSQMLGLIFCGNAECLQGGSDENCTTLLCGVLAKHPAAPSAADDDSNACQCFCHLLIDLPKTNLQAALLAISPLHLVNVLHCFAAPVHDIDHPPLT